MKKYLILVSIDERMMVPLCSDTFSPDILLVLIAGICKTFTELYDDKMPLQNAIVTMAEFYNVWDPTSNGTVTMDYLLNHDDEVQWAKLEEAYEATEDVGPHDLLGYPVYLSVRSYLNGKGYVSEEDIDEYFKNHPESDN